MSILTVTCLFAIPPIVDSTSPSKFADAACASMSSSDIVAISEVSDVKSGEVQVSDQLAGS